MPNWRITVGMETEPTFASHHDVIRYIGGPTALARRLDLTPVNTTVHWTSRGIPPRYWHSVVALVAEKGVSFTADALSQLPAQVTETEAA